MTTSAAISIFTHSDIGGKVCACAGIDIQAPLRTPFGKVCRIDVCLHDKCAAALRLLEETLSFFEPALKRIVQKIGVFENPSEFFPVLLAVPGNSKNFYLIHFNHSMENFR